jgi:hypothetical protein
VNRCLLKIFRTAACGCLLSVLACGNVLAAESGTGFYLLGSKTTMAGFVPPPGTYFADTNYYYSGGTDIDFLSHGVEFEGGVDASAYYQMPIALWVLDEPVLGGNLGFNAIVPIGWKSMESSGEVTFPRRSAEVGFASDETAVGDPVIGSMLGWHQGNWHTSVSTLLNIPVGQWEEGNPTNIGFNRWAFDATGAVTFLDPAAGVELSGAAGFTFNGENLDTGYQTGTEFHAEFAAMLVASHTFSIGVNGYWYDQITGDSGGPAVLGGFEGQVFGIGPAINWTILTASGVPIVTSFRYFREFEAVNRLEGDAFMFNITIPLSAGQAHPG